MKQSNFRTIESVFDALSQEKKQKIYPGEYGYITWICSIVHRRLSEYYREAGMSFDLSSETVRKWVERKKMPAPILAILIHCTKTNQKK